MMASSLNCFFGVALALMTACYAVPVGAQATSEGTHSTTQIATSAKKLDPADWEPILLESASANEVPSPQPVDSRDVQLELVQLHEALRSITPHQRGLVNKWVVTNQGKVWREVLDQLTLHNLAGAPSSLRLMPPCILQLPMRKWRRGIDNAPTADLTRLRSTPAFILLLVA